MKKLLYSLLLATAVFAFTPLLGMEPLKKGDLKPLVNIENEPYFTLILLYLGPTKSRALFQHMTFKNKRNEYFLNAIKKELFENFYHVFFDENLKCDTEKSELTLDDICSLEGGFSLPVFLSAVVAVREDEQPRFETLKILRQFTMDEKAENSNKGQAIIEALVIAKKCKNPKILNVLCGFVPKYKDAIIYNFTARISRCCNRILSPSLKPINDFLTVKNSIEETTNDEIIKKLDSEFCSNMKRSEYTDSLMLRLIGKDFSNSIKFIFESDTISKTFLGENGLTFDRLLIISCCYGSIECFKLLTSYEHINNFLTKETFEESLWSAIKSFDELTCKYKETDFAKLILERANNRDRRETFFMDKAFKEAVKNQDFMSLLISEINSKDSCWTLRNRDLKSIARKFGYKP